VGAACHRFFPCQVGAGRQGAITGAWFHPTLEHTLNHPVVVAGRGSFCSTTRVFSTKKPAMVVVVVLLEGVLHQETSYTWGCFAPRDQPWWWWWPYLWVYNLPFLPKRVWLQNVINPSYHLSNAILHFLTIGVYTFSKITMSLCPPRWYRQPYWLMD
jgi:hypothetical protein